MGVKDKPAIDAGRTKRKSATGLLIALCSYIPTFVLTTIYAVLLPTATTTYGIIANICGIAKVGLFLLSGAYTGVMSAISIGDQPLHSFWWIYPIIAIPTIAVCTVAYILGTKDIHFTKLMIAPTPEEVEIKREKRLERRNKR